MIQLKRLNILLILIQLSSCYFSPSDEITKYVLPTPKSITHSDGILLLNAQIQFDTTDQLMKRAYDRFKRFVNARCTLTNTTIPLKATQKQLPNIPDAMFPNEAYEIHITDTISVTYDTQIGFIRALTTLSQLIQPSNDTCACFIRKTKIIDSPKYGYRGLLLDTNRNYFPVSDIYRVLDGMEFYKLNVFHWHFLDSHSFPIWWPYNNYSFPKSGA
jgi:N-acetyl-beta-hexosaminidase